MNNDAINDYVLDSGFLFSLSNHVWKVVLGMDQVFTEVGRSDGVWNEFEDILYYVNDIFEQESPEITEKLSNLLIRMLFPGLIGCFLQSKKPYFIGKKLALWVLAKICEVVKGKSVVEAALVLIFKKEVNKGLLELIENSPPSVPPENFIITQDLNAENFVFEKIKDLAKSSDSEQIFFLLLIIQGAIHNPAVSKDLLSELGILSQKQLRNQKLVSRILQEDLPKTLNHNSEVLDMLFYLIQKESLTTFSEYQIACNIIFELTGSSTTSLDPSHESVLNETFVKKSLDLHESLNSQSAVQLIISLFRTEWSYIKTLNFHSVVPVPSMKNLKSGLGSIRKSSNESVMSVEKYKIQESLRILFLIMKLKFVTSQEEFPDNPINSSKNSKLIPGEYINTRNTYPETIKYEKAKLDNSTVLIPDVENQFLILEYSKDLFPLCLIKIVHSWTDLKIGVNHSTCSVKISITDSLVSYNLQLCSREDTQGLVNFLKPKMKFALNFETEMIRSFFEDYYQRL